MSVTPEQLVALGAPTPEDEVKQRPIFNKNKQKVGDLDYIDARYVMERLDDVVGQANWQSQFREVEGGIVCRLGILVMYDNTLVPEWVWKEDIGTESTIEAEKGSYSDALKRAAVHWGIARDLYDAREDNKNEAPQRESNGAQPQATGWQPRPAAQRSSNGNGGSTSNSNGPARPLPVDPADAPWFCPDHNGVVAFPAGISGAGRRYDAFYACPEGRECPNRAPRGLRVKPEHLVLPVEDDLPF